MAIALVQTGTALEVTGGTSGTIGLTSVSAGNLLTLVVDDIGGNASTFSVSDDKGNTWAQAVYNEANGYSCAIWYCLSAAAGTTTITITASSATDFAAQAQEYSGAGNWTLDTTSSIDESAATTSHVCSASGSVIDTTGNDLVICNSTTDTGSSFGVRTAGSGYTQFVSTTSVFVRPIMWQYQIFSTAQANEQGAFTSVNSKATAACIAAFLSGGNCAGGGSSGCWWPNCATASPCYFYIFAPATTNTNEQYDVNADTWTTKASLPSPNRTASRGATIGGGMYVFGGHDGSSYLADNDQYIPNSWTSKTNMVSPGRQDGGVVTVSGKAYYYGGISAGSTIIADNDAYDGAGDSWASKTDMTVAADGIYFCTIASKCYKFFGRRATAITLVQTTYEYDPSGDSWSTKTSGPSPARYLGACGVVSSKAYCMFGIDDTGTRIGDTDEYDPSGDSWTSMTTGPATLRSNAGSGAIPTSLFVAGGGGPFGATTDVDEYTPDVWTSKTNRSGAISSHSYGNP